MSRNESLSIERRPFLTLKEAAGYFCINPAKLSRMVNEPQCPFVLKNGRKNLIKKEALLEYLMRSSKI